MWVEALEIGSHFETWYRDLRTEKFEIEVQRRCHSIC